MRWLLLLFFPIACLSFSWAGAWGLRRRRHNHGAFLSCCRLVLLVFPFLLLGVIFLKHHGPSFWMEWVTAIPGRGIVLWVIFLVVGVRWIGEMIAGQALRWRVEGPDLERVATPALLAALDFEKLCSALAPPRWLAWLPRPRLFLSKVTGAGHLTSGFAPRICLDASLVPATYRASDLWWQSVMPAPELGSASLDPLRAVVAHELAHFRRGDHLRTLVVLYTGALLPWEWLYGELSLEKFWLTHTWVFKQWSRFMSFVGQPFRQWLMEEHHLRETLADEEVVRLLPAGAEHLREVRALYPAASDFGVVTHDAHSARLGGVALLAVGCFLLTVSPGRIPYQVALGRNQPSTRLPCGWSMAVEGRSQASAVYIPGRNGPGKVMIDCQQIDPGHPPEFRALGRNNPHVLPTPCDVQMDWDVRYLGKNALIGNEVVMSLTQSCMVVRENTDMVAAYALPRSPLASMDGHWSHYSLKASIQGQPRMDILYLYFKMPFPGRYVFCPPRLSLILPGGERRPYPYVLNAEP